LKILKSILLIITIVSLILIVGCAADEAPGEEVAVHDADFGLRDPASYSANLNMWAHTPAQPNFMIENYNRLFPNVNIELTIIPAAQQQQQKMTAVMSGTNVPDIFTARTQFVRAFVETDMIYADLLSAPFDASDIAGRLEPYIIALGSHEGALRAISWQCPVGGIFYRKSLAEQFFGVSDPASMEQFFSNYDVLLETAREIVRQSGGEVRLLPEFTMLQHIMRGSVANGYVVDGRLHIDPMLEEYFRLSRIFYEEGLCWLTEPGTPPMYALMESDQTFAYIYPTWGLNFNIMPNHPDQAGDWGLTQGPNPYAHGGTFMGIYVNTPHPEEAWTFVNFVFSDEFMLTYSLEFGDFTSNLSANEYISALPDAQALEIPMIQFMGGQNVFQFFSAELERGVNYRVFTRYDEAFDAFLTSAVRMYASGQLSWDEAWDQFRQDVRSFAPHLVVD